MRIAVGQRLTLTHGIRGGVETQAQGLANRLRAREHDLLVLTTPHPDGRPGGDEEGVAVRYVAPGSYRGYQRRWWDACFRALAREHSLQPFDVLLSQGAGALGYLPRAAGELGIPCVVLLHGTPLGDLRTLWRGARSPRGVYRLGRLLTTLPPLLLCWQRALPAVTSWIAVSPHVAQQARSLFRVSPERMTVVPNGVDVMAFRLDSAARHATRASLGSAESAPVLVATGRLEYEKGFHYAIRAVRSLRAEFPEIRLLIAGDGSYAGSLRREAADLESAITFLGRVSHAALPQLLAAADVFVMPTLCEEGLPLALVEALASGVPAVATASGGVPDVIDHGRSGLLVPRGDTVALVAAAACLLANRDARSAMGSAGRQAAVERFSREQMVLSTERVLEGAAGAT